MNIISALANKPTVEGGLTPQAFKAKFDEGGLALKAFVNALLEELEGTSSAAWLGITQISGLDATTVQGALAALKTLADTVQAHAASHASDGEDAITPESIGAAETEHEHSASDITSGTFGTSMIADGAITSAKLDSNGIALKLNSAHYGTELPQTLADGELFVLYQETPT